VILVKSKRAGERVMASITRFLENKLKLTINQDKSKVAATDAITFLGFAFKGSASAGRTRRLYASSNAPRN
jgi:RNA-directed DNA polymerase